MDDAIQKIRQVKPKAQIIFSPVFGEIEPVEIWEFIQRPEVIDLDIKFQLQLHKFVYAPEQRGV
jgi:7-carboxy-7-deazaguanine synthase